MCCMGEFPCCLELASHVLIMYSFWGEKELGGAAQSLRSILGLIFTSSPSSLLRAKSRPLLAELLFFSFFFSLPCAKLSVFHFCCRVLAWKGLFIKACLHELLGCLKMKKVASTCISIISSNLHQKDLTAFTLSQDLWLILQSLHSLALSNFA